MLLLSSATSYGFPTGDFKGSQAIPDASRMMITCHTFMKIHRMYNTKSES